MKKMIGFKIDFLLILAGFWGGFGRVWGTKLDQKSTKNRYGKMMKFFSSLFTLIFNGFLMDFYFQNQ